MIPKNVIPCLKYFKVSLEMQITNFYCKRIGMKPPIYGQLWFIQLITWSISTCIWIIMFGKRQHVSAENYSSLGKDSTIYRIYILKFLLFLSRNKSNCVQWKSILNGMNPMLPLRDPLPRTTITRICCLVAVNYHNNTSHAIEVS